MNPLNEPGRIIGLLYAKKMHFLRNHWYDIGLVLALGVGLFLFITKLSGLSGLLWVSLVSLFLHQFEEYRYPGYFPGMINSVLFSSIQPDRFPLNSNTSLIVNVVIGWQQLIINYSSSRQSASTIPPNH